MDENSDIPRINWPRESGDYKVVQLDIDGQPYLRFQIYGYEDHSTIVRKLLGLFNNIDCAEMISERTGLRVAALDWKRYKVHGMGKSKINVEQKQAFFYGESEDYDIGIDPKHLDSIRELAPDWKITIKGH